MIGLNLPDLYHPILLVRTRMTMARTCLLEQNSRLDEILNADMVDSGTTGHRQRLKDRFVADKDVSRTDEALLELLLCYAIPQKDVQPLAQKLIAELGSLSKVLVSDLETLCKFDGIKSNSAVLLKLVDWIRTCYPHKELQEAEHTQPKISQLELFELKNDEKVALLATKKTAAKTQTPVIPRSGTELFTKAVLKEAIELLPKLPETESLDEIREFLRNNLHFSSVGTRRRYTSYIVRRIFPEGYADQALRTFATKYLQGQELRDVCFYRFCQVERLMLTIVEALLLPVIGNGQLNRDSLRNYLAQRYPGAKSIKDSAQAIVEAFVAGGIVKASRLNLTFVYRNVLLPSFAFVLHSEFPEPGMYDISKLEDNQAIRALLWNPDQLLPSLYELRNQGIIAKVSEIDSVRQFTTKWNLTQVVNCLVTRESRM